MKELAYHATDISVYLPLTERESAYYIGQVVDNALVCGVKTPGFQHRF